MTLTAEERYWDFRFRLFFSEMRICAGNVQKENSTHVAEFDFLTEELSGC